MSTTVNNPGEGQDQIKQPTAAEVKKDVENHKQAAVHHQEAAKHHLDAAKHHEAGNHDKAGQSTVIANGHHLRAGEYEKEDAKHHASITK